MWTPRSSPPKLLMERAQSRNFADLLKHYRVAAGLTQEELAERAHLSRNAISALERGARQSPRKDTVALVASALGLSEEEHAELLAAARLSRLQTQSIVSDEIASVPPPTSAGSPTDLTFPTSTLPFPSTPLIGREREVASAM